MQHPFAGYRYVLFFEAEELAALDAQGRFAVDRLDGFSFCSIAPRITGKVCARLVFPDFNRNAVTTLIHCEFPPIPNRHIGVNRDGLILPESRGIPRL